MDCESYQWPVWIATGEDPAEISRLNSHVGWCECKEMLVDEDGETCRWFKEA